MDTDEHRFFDGGVGGAHEPDWMGQKQVLRFAQDDNFKTTGCSLLRTITHPSLRDEWGTRRGCDRAVVRASERCWKNGSSDRGDAVFFGVLRLGALRLAQDDDSFLSLSRWSDGLGGGVGGGPGPLEVVASEPAGDVDDLADEVEARDEAGLHGAGVEGGGGDAAGGDFGFGEAFGGGGDDVGGVDFFFQEGDVGVGEEGLVGRDVVGEPAFGEAGGKDLAEGFEGVGWEAGGAGG